MSKNINTFAAGLLALTSIAAASVGCQPQASEQTAANTTEFVEQTETVETEAASTFELTEEPTEEPTAEPVETPAEPTAEPTEEPIVISGMKFIPNSNGEGYSVEYHGSIYPIGEIDPEGLSFSHGIGLVIEPVPGKGKIVIYKEHLYKCIDVAEQGGNLLMLITPQKVYFVRKGQMYEYEDKKNMQLESAYFIRVGGEVMATDEIPWKPMS